MLNVLSRTFESDRASDVIMDTKNSIIIVKCSEIDSPTVLEHVSLHSHAHFVCQGKRENITTNTQTLRYKCRLHGKPGKPHGENEQPKSGKQRTDHNSPMCECKAYIRVVHSDGKAVMRMQLIHSGHTPGEANDIVHLPLRADVKAEIATSMRLTHNPKGIKRWISQWVKEVLVKTLNLDFEVLSIDGRFAPTTQMIQNIGKIMGESYIFSKDDSKNTFMHLCRQPGSSFVYRSHSRGSIAFVYDPILGFQATLVDDALNIHRIQVLSKWDKDVMMTFPDAILKVSYTLRDIFVKDTHLLED